MFTHSLDSVHFNSRGVVQVGKEEMFEDLQTTLALSDAWFNNDQNLKNPGDESELSFFKREVNALLAYRDFHIGMGGPETYLYAVGKLSSFKNSPLYVRLLLENPDKTSIPPSLEFIFLKQKGMFYEAREDVDGGDDNFITDDISEFMEMPPDLRDFSDSYPDRWFYIPGSIFYGVEVKSNLGKQSLGLIPRIDKALKTQKPLFIPEALRKKFNYFNFYPRLISDSSDDF